MKTWMKSAALAMLAVAAVWAGAAIVQSQANGNNQPAPPAPPTAVTDTPGLQAPPAAPETAAASAAESQAKPSPIPAPVAPANAKPKAAH